MTTPTPPPARARRENHTSGTPGPWETDAGPSEHPLTFDAERNVYPPDHTQTGGHQYPGPIAVVAEDEDGGWSNYYKIAAAPALYEALEVLLEARWMVGTEPERFNAVIDQATAALALARGEESDG